MSRCLGWQGDAQHPELYLERADDLDENVSRGEVEVAEPVHTAADAFPDVCQTCDEVLRRRIGFERTRVYCLDF